MSLWTWNSLETYTLESDFKMRPVFKKTLLTCAAIASVGITSPAFASDTLEIRNFIGTINWSNGDMNVDVEKNKGDTDISGRNDITIDGGQENIDGKKCKSSYGSFSMDWFGKEKSGNFGGYEDLEDYPILTINLPKDTNVVVQNSIIFTDGAPSIGAADLDLRHCGSVSLGDIEETLALNSRGSGNVDVGNTGQIVASLKGSGDLSGENSGEVLIQSQGSGDVDLEDVGALEVKTQGSGDFTAANVDGDATLLSRGSGDIELGDVSGSLSYASSGSGDLEVDSVTGAALDISSSGSGDIDIDGGEVGTLTAVARGSATIEFAGEAENANLRASGSGDIRVDRVSGSVEIKSSGSGDVNISDRG